MDMNKKKPSKKERMEIEREVCEQSRRIVFGQGSEHVRTTVNPQRSYGC